MGEGFELVSAMKVETRSQSPINKILSIAYSTHNAKKPFQTCGWYFGCVIKFCFYIRFDISPQKNIDFLELLL
jgi:hypothetical protein